MQKNYKRRLGFILIPILMLLIVTAIVMLLWNAILPAVIGVKIITFWQAMGILVLSKILFGGFRGRFGRHSWQKHKRHHFFSKMEHLSDEEKLKMKEKMKERFGNHPFCKNN